jgi:pyridoxine kinase
VKQVVSIQSFVASGRVGNRAAAFVLERLGVEVVEVPTVVLAHHPGHGGPAGWSVGAAEVQGLLRGLAASGRLRPLDAVLTGYLGDAGIGEAVLAFLADLRAAGLRPLWLCDPVMGDDGRGFFVRAGLPELFRDRLVPAADVVTPNRFELEWLTGLSIRNRAEALRAARELHTRGPRVVVATSLPASSPDRLGVLWSEQHAAFWIETPRLTCPTAGAGDLFAARLLVELLNESPPAQALARTVAACFAVLTQTARMAADELALIAAQHALAGQTADFPVVALDGSGEAAG